MKKLFFKLIFFTIFISLFPVFVLADDEILEELIPINTMSEEVSLSTSGEPTINARHAIIYDRNSQKAIYSKKTLKRCKMASTTKIMTAIVVIENTNLTDLVEVSSKASSTGGSRLGLSKHDKISVEHLLYGLMLKSGNDAAVALAENTGGNVEKFASMMNSKAKVLGLLNTNFVTPHGLDNENHYTTALDLAILTDYALKNDIFSKIVKTKNYTVLINNNPKNISNTNELLGNFEGIYGVKTGFTNGANRCLVTACKRGDLDFICIVLGCDTKKDRTKDTIKLLSYAFNNFTLINLKDIAINKFNAWKISHQNSFFINKGINQTLNLYLDENAFPFSNIALENSKKEKIDYEISFSSYYNAPLEKNTQVGVLNLYVDNQKYYSIKILNSNEIMNKTTYDYISYILKNYFNFFTTKKLYLFNIELFLIYSIFIFCKYFLFYKF